MELLKILIIVNSNEYEGENDILILCYSLIAIEPMSHFPNRKLSFKAVAVFISRVVFTTGSVLIFIDPKHRIKCGLWWNRSFTETYLDIDLKGKLKSE